MTIILKSDVRASGSTGQNIFGLPTNTGEAVMILDFSAGLYLMRGPAGDLEERRFNEVLDYSRAGPARFCTSPGVWQVVDENRVVPHYDSRTGSTGILIEGANQDYEQLITRLDADVLQTETITIANTVGAYYWLSVSGRGSVTISGDLSEVESPNGFTATEKQPLRFLMPKNESRTLTFTVSGHISGFSVTRGSGGTVVPYSSKAVYGSRGKTELSLAAPIVEALALLEDYTVCVEALPAGGMPFGDTITEIGTPKGVRLRYHTAGAVRRIGVWDASGVTEVLTNLATAAGSNPSIAWSVTGKGASVMGSDGVGLGVATKSVALSGPSPILHSPSLISRIVVYPRAFDEYELRELAHAWTTTLPPL